jgi:tetratricopeptide (TPR) repeat protein
VTLVTDISQGQQGSSAANGNSVSPQIAQLGEAEVASSIIITTLAVTGDVSPVERYVVGTGLENGENYQLALPILLKAAQQKSDPRTAANAWRASAEIYYLLGYPAQAESDVNLAKRSFDEPDPTKFYKESNIAFTDLFDVYYQVYSKVPKDCATAIKEWNEAAGLLKVNKHLMNSSNSKAAERKAGDALANICYVQRASLEKEIPF